MRTIITGWSRGGLSFVKTLLEVAGNNVGANFDHTLTENNFTRILAKAQDIEVSSAVVPFLNRSEFHNTIKIFITRDPMRVINSLMFHNRFNINSPHTAFMHDNIRNIRKSINPLVTTCSHIYHWWDLINNQVYSKSHVVTLEEYPADLLKKLQKADSKIVYNPKQLPYVPGTINSSYCKQLITPSLLPVEYKDFTIRLLQQLHYHERVWLPRGGHAHYVTPEWHS